MGTESSLVIAKGRGEEGAGGGTRSNCLQALVFFGAMEILGPRQR